MNTARPTHTGAKIRRANIRDSRGIRDILFLRLYARVHAVSTECNALLEHVTQARGDSNSIRVMPPFFVIVDYNVVVASASHVMNLTWPIMGDN